MASYKRFKRHEREIAKLLGGFRIPNNGYGQPDVIAGKLAVQVKTRESFPKWLVDAVDQSIADASPGMQPVVILTRGKQGKPTRRLVVVDLATLIGEKHDADWPSGPRRS